MYFFFKFINFVLNIIGPLLVINAETAPEYHGIGRSDSE